MRVGRRHGAIHHQHDSAVVVRRNALNCFAECIVNEKLRKLLNDDAITTLICETLQDPAGFTFLFPPP